MPDSTISNLTPAEEIQASDLFVLEQDGVAKSMTGQLFVNWLTNYADGHGGIQSIVLASTSGLEKTYEITYSDGDSTEFTVADGNGFASVTWEVISGQAGNGRVQRGTFVYKDGTSNFIDVYDGYKGDTGTPAYVWIKWASVSPTSDLDMTDIPSDYIGVYSGSSSTAPEHYTSYSWYKYKGEKGNTGDPSTVETVAIAYAAGDDGVMPPVGFWSVVPPTVAQGSYLWTRITIVFNSGPNAVFYTNARQGIDGSGSVSSVNNVGPDANGNVSIDSGDVPYDATTVESQLDLLSSFVYSSGDTVTSATMYAFGWVSNGAYAAVDVVLPKFVPAGSSVTVTGFTPLMRISSGGYLGNSYTTDRTANINAATPTGNVLHLILNKTGGWNAPEQTPICGQVTISFEVS